MTKEEFNKMKQVKQMINDVKGRRCPQGNFYNSNKHSIQELEAEYLATFKKTVAQHEVSDPFKEI